MFDNIGGKIKTLALVSTIIGMVAFGIYGLALLFSGAVLIGILVAGLGCLSAWIGSFLLYGFGELIEQQAMNNAYSAQIVRLLSRQANPPKQTTTNASAGSNGKSGYSLSQMAEQRNVNTAKGSDFWLCKSCKTKNDAFALYCKNCGQFK